MKGAVLGNRYELLEEIGQGGMATVYKARCRILERIVAIKVLKGEFSRDRIFVHSFQTEALAAARLSHPNIVNIFDVGQDGDIHYIVMEHVEGKTLKQIIDEQAPLRVDMAINIAVMICDGIHHAHENGIIHRDIKPHNILITNKGIVKVADFGIAQAISKKTLTFGGDIVGSVHYISPEQAKGEPVGPATDIYSLGCVLYEMLTGRPPFDAEGAITIALKHIHDQPVAPQEINPAVTEELGVIMDKAMAKIPSYRFLNAEEMRNSLLTLDNPGLAKNKKRNNNKENTMVMMPLTSEGNEPMARKRKKKLRPAGVLIMVIALLGFLSGIFFVMGNNLFGKEVEVPDLVGMNIEEANKTLTQKGLKMYQEAKIFSDDIKKDEIISQKPAAKTKVKEGREINVTVSNGPELIKVPSITGLKLVDAELELRNKGFKINPVEESYDDKYEEGMVISQNPRYGSSARKGQGVDLLVSKGKAPQKVAMPSLIGLTHEQAKQKLAENNLSAGESLRKESREYYNNYVIAQDTDPGVMIDEGSKVILTISNGPGPGVRTKAIEFTLPSEQDFYRVVVTVRDAKDEREVYSQLHREGETVNVGINYYGTGTARITLNGTEHQVIDL